MKSRLLLLGALVFAAGTAMAAPFSLSLQRGGTALPKAIGPVGGAAVTATELDTSVMEGDGADSANAGDIAGHPIVNRSIRKGNATGGPAVLGRTRAKTNPELKLSFDGPNFFDQRFANGGNQFSVEPPDQALCVGQGFVLASVNNVMRIYSTDGTKLVGPVDLNTFYGYPAAINRSNGKRGPSITDPVCYYDADTQRWFHVVLTLDHVGTSAALSGNNHLDIAVSQTSDPTGPWNIYKLPLQNNGTDGTPDHQCAGGYCLGDYPHIGADANAIFLTTNEFAVFGDGFYGSQIYAISKRALAAGAPSPNVVMWNGGDASIPAPAFTVWPATSPAGQYDISNGGTEFMLSSDAVFYDSGTSQQIWVWAVSNTSAIDLAPQSLQLTVGSLPVKQYAVPLATNAQKAGNTPLRDCVATFGCAGSLGVSVHSYSSPRPVGVNDSRMQQVTYANGKLWGVLDTDVVQGVAHSTGIAYFILNPHSGAMFANDIVSMSDASIGYPTLAVTSGGRGVLGFSVVGPNDYPSVGYAGVDARNGVGDLHVAVAGAGPWDGFTGIPAFGSRPRWGDYSAAVADGNSVWLSAEYIAQTCTFAQYTAAPFGTCGNTRGAFSNWATRIIKVTP